MQRCLPDGIIASRVRVTESPGCAAIYIDPNA
jgi:hypothetical protein